ncbi:hypothetical protein PV10_03015 [Exophiala mesophila]|uniref:dTDP-4-amino-4,6-dideoxygalactose transaminase n=1 Tax=Exophiala mesophila TaxID=212818 RepID=A0A0D2A8P4_EXOME|nr:uncharacterized protein PV10_03015 [Exophiala mesophila]KIV95348.1 hypothetical protein PV10_03015 [Exophiala mesophila]
MIPLRLPARSEHELEYVSQVLESGSLGGGGPFTQKCEEWLGKQLSCAKVFLTTSGTAALTMAALIAKLQPGDEVILPSYTFVSTGNAFASRGAVPVFVDIIPGQMNIDASIIEKAVTSKTKAIVPVHYGGVACDMTTIMSIAERHHLLVIEDAAHSLQASFQGRPLGSIGHLACFSFHETKNITAGGQGGALIVNDPSLVDGAELVYENGTNRAQHLSGKAPSYSWQTVGSNFVLSEVLAALLWSQLEMAETILNRRKYLHQRYSHLLLNTQSHRAGYISIPPDHFHNCEPNAHIFYILLRDPTLRARLQAFMKDRSIQTSPHYVPLHSSRMGSSQGRFIGEDNHTTHASKQVLRLPLYYALSDSDQELVVDAIESFFATLEVSDTAELSKACS